MLPSGCRMTYLAPASDEASLRLENHRNNLPAFDGVEALDGVCREAARNGLDLVAVLGDLGLAGRVGGLLRDLGQKDRRLLTLGRRPAFCVGSLLGVLNCSQIVLFAHNDNLRVRHGLAGGIYDFDYDVPL